MQATIQLLDKSDILQHTDSMQVILTKSDLMPIGVDKNKFAIDFLTCNYLNFMNLMANYCVKYNINSMRKNQPIIHLFSLGHFMLGKTFEFIKDDSDILIDSILNLTSTKRLPNWYSFLQKSETE